jgi:hypothetical protein
LPIGTQLCRPALVACSAFTEDATCESISGDAEGAEEEGEFDEDAEGDDMMG